MLMASGAMNSGQGAGNNIAATGGTGTATTVGGQNNIDTFAQSSNLDNNVNLGSADQIMKSIPGAMDDNENITDVFNGTVLSQGNINHNAFDANNLGWGSVGASEAFSPGNNLNAKIPTLSTKGQQQGG